MPCASCLSPFFRSELSAFNSIWILEKPSLLGALVAEYDRLEEKLLDCIGSAISQRIQDVPNVLYAYSLLLDPYALGLSPFLHLEGCIT